MVRLRIDRMSADFAGEYKERLLHAGIMYKLTCSIYAKADAAQKGMQYEFQFHACIDIEIAFWRFNTTYMYTLYED